MRFTVLLALVVAGAAFAHDAHVTLAEVEHVSEAATLQVALWIESLDLDAELAARLDHPPVLETATADTAIVALLRDHFVVRDASGAVRPLQWVGKEIGPRESWLYFEVEVPDGIDGLTLRYTLGTGLHAQQVNTANFVEGDARWSIVFTRTRPEAELRP